LNSLGRLVVVVGCSVVNFVGRWSFRWSLTRWSSLLVSCDSLLLPLLVCFSLFSVFCFSVSRFLGFSLSLSLYPHRDLICLFFPLFSLLALSYSRTWFRISSFLSFFFFFPSLVSYCCLSISLTFILFHSFPFPSFFSFLFSPLGALCLLLGQGPAKKGPVIPTLNPILGPWSDQIASYFIILLLVVVVVDVAPRSRALTVWSGRCFVLHPSLGFVDGPIYSSIIVSRFRSTRVGISSSLSFLSL
jgi:hypothetical protein